jgi:CHAT domain-containing protein/tetratricopeptide (TPR) repeat protein
MPTICQSSNLPATADILRENDPDPNRVLLWLRGEGDGRHQHWQRISGHRLVRVEAAEGLLAIPIRVANFRQKRSGELRNFIARFWKGRRTSSTRYVLPTGEWVEPLGEPRSDALLVWTPDTEGFAGPALVEESWPEQEECRRLASNLFLVIGVKGGGSSSQPGPSDGEAALLPGEGGPDPNPVDLPVDFDRYSRQVSSLAGQGMWDQAETAAARLLGWVRRHGGENHPLVVAGLNQLGQVYHLRGDLGSAERCYRQALALPGPDGAPEHHDHGTTRNNLALICQARGDLAQAEDLHRRALHMRRAALGEAHPLVAVSLNNLGLLYHAAASGPAVGPLLSQALEILRTTLGEDHPDVATCLDNLAVLCQARSDTPSAILFAGRAEQIRNASQGKVFARVAESHNILAAWNMLRLASVPSDPPATEVVKAGPNLETVFPDAPNGIPAAPPPETSPAFLDFAVPDLPEAPVFHPGPGKRTLVLRMGKARQTVLAHAEQEGDSSRSLEEGETAALPGPAWPFVPPAAFESVPEEPTGEMRMTESVPSEPVDTPLPAAEIDVGASRPTFAAAAAQGDTAVEGPAAEFAPAATCEPHVEEQPVATGPVDPAIVPPEDQGAEPVDDSEDQVILDLHLPDEAEILPGSEAGPALPDLAEDPVVEVVVPSPPLTLEMPLFDPAMAANAEEVRPDSSPDEPLDQEADLFVLDVEGEPDVVVSEAAETATNVCARDPFGDETPRPPAPEIAAPVPVPPPAASLTAIDRLPLPGQTLEADARRLAEATPLSPTRSEIDLLRRVQAGLDEFLGWAGQPSADSSERVRTALDAILRYRPVLTQALAPRHGPAREELSAVGSTEVAKALPPGSALVELVRFPLADHAPTEPAFPRARYMAFVLPAAQPDQARLVDLGEAAAIDAMVADLRTRIANGGAADGWPGKPILPGTPAHAEMHDLGTRLRQAVFDPLSAALAGCTRLFLVPAGSLAGLPFDVLPTDPDRYLLDTHTITYLSSGRDVFRFGRAADGQPAAPFVAADPDFDRGVDGFPILQAMARQAPVYRPFRGPEDAPLRFGRLTGSRRCAMAVAGMLGVQPLLDRAVLKDRLRTLASPHILHLATHAFVREERLPGCPTEGLALAGANGNGSATSEDGLLTDVETAGLNLLDTQLVVLPAYAAPAADNGLGLRRAFLLAGAQTLVLSLWKVTDWYVKELLLNYYERLLDGEGRAEALREARLALKARYPHHPVYWGGFVCQGDPGPLPG